MSVYGTLHRDNTQFFLFKRQNPTELPMWMETDVQLIAKHGLNPQIASLKLKKLLKMNIWNLCTELYTKDRLTDMKSKVWSTQWITTTNWTFM